MSTQTEIKVPDIGSTASVDVIEVMVKVGDTINKDDSIITLESEKASMEIPSPSAGVVEKIAVKVGDKIAQGGLILTLKTQEAETAKPQEKNQEKTAPAAKEKQSDVAVSSALQTTDIQESKTAVKEKAEEMIESALATNEHFIYAGPAVRRTARELGVDLNLVTGSGDKGRISKDDINNYVKNRLAQAPRANLNVTAQPIVDFSQFGDIETKPLSKIKRLTGENVHRSWVTVPHVTQFDEADITELENFRLDNKDQAEKQGYKLTMLAFIVKAVTSALMEFPQFNASLDASGENLIFKKYFNVGIAVDTPNGLVVPVIRDTDKKGIFAIAKDMSDISKLARDKKLMPKDMQGSNFTVSSLGGISGTAFTPIINTPDVAILGVSRSKMTPVYRDGQFVPRLMLPLSLSYDHRVIDGAEGARFTQYLAAILMDIRKVLL